MVNAEQLADALRSLNATHVGFGTDDSEPIGVDDQDFVGWSEVRSFDTTAGRIDVTRKPPASAHSTTTGTAQSRSISTDSRCSLRR